MEPGSGRGWESSEELIRDPDFKDAAGEGSEDMRSRLLAAGGGALAMWSQEASDTAVCSYWEGRAYTC